MLNGVAFASAGPGDIDEMHAWWWRDPLLSGRSYIVVLLLSLGRTAVEAVGDGERAVDLERTPHNEAPWPVPATTGTEVFDTAGV